MHFHLGRLGVNSQILSLDTPSLFGLVRRGGQQGQPQVWGDGEAGHELDYIS